MDDTKALRELIELRISALERMATREFAYIKEAMERVADQSAPIATVQSLLIRVDKLEKLVSKEIDNLEIETKALRSEQVKANNKIRVLWWVGSVVTAILVAIIT